MNLREELLEQAREFLESVSVRSRGQLERALASAFDNGRMAEVVRKNQITMANMADSISSRGKSKIKSWRLTRHSRKNLAARGFDTKQLTRYSLRRLKRPYGGVKIKG